MFWAAKMKATAVLGNVPKPPAPTTSVLSDTQGSLVYLYSLKSSTKDTINLFFNLEKPKFSVEPNVFL